MSSHPPRQDIDTDTGPTYCARHPGVETELACGRCGTPICPRCSVMTPVGARCRDCAQMKALPVFQVGPIMLVRAVVAALVVGALSGGAWGLLSYVLPLGFLVFFIAMGIGYLVGESVSLATNRKRGRQLAVVAVGGVIVAFLISNAITYGVLINGLDLFGLIALVLGAVVAAGRVQA